jgi:hypothetical protein
MKKLALLRKGLKFEEGEIGGRGLGEIWRVGVSQCLGEQMENCLLCLA